jgi:hypothetical protein
MVSNPRSEALFQVPERAELLTELASFLLRLEEITSALDEVGTQNLELPVRRLQADLLRRSEFESWQSMQRLAHVYSLAMQETAAHLDEVRFGQDRQQRRDHAQLAQEALQRAVVRVRRLYD